MTCSSVWGSTPWIPNRLDGPSCNSSKRVPLRHTLIPCQRLAPNGPSPGPARRYQPHDEHRHARGPGGTGQGDRTAAKCVRGLFRCLPLQTNRPTRPISWIIAVTPPSSAMSCLRVNTARPFLWIAPASRAEAWKCGSFVQNRRTQACVRRLRRSVRVAGAPSQRPNPLHEAARNEGGETDEKAFTVGLWCCRYRLRRAKS